MTKIEQQVMAGVAGIYLARKMLSRTALECYALFASAFSLTMLVSVSSVERNFISVAEGGLANILNFSIVAFANTSYVVQGTVLLAAIALAGMLADLVRAVRVAPRFA
ncbi:MAG: hypothetical protein QG621_134 [Patescibacteria group bacterium]|jgi:hypothetical protein|nr:hypothetical protein [Patescibacteria group bacterium]